VLMSAGRQQGLESSTFTLSQHAVFSCECKHAANHPAMRAGHRDGRQANDLEGNTSTARIIEAARPHQQNTLELD
jgi:hypothetical protein